MCCEWTPSVLIIYRSWPSGKKIFLFLFERNKRLSSHFPRECNCAWWCDGVPFCSKEQGEDCERAREEIQHGSYVQSSQSGEEGARFREAGEIDTEEGKGSGAGCGWFVELAAGLTTVRIFRGIWYRAKASLFLSAFGLED